MVATIVAARKSKKEPTETSRLGHLGEEISAHWLRCQGYSIVHQRWSCPYGEVDLIAFHPDKGLAFVEVKTRAIRNWDEGGLLALTPQKQAKLWETAELFLAKFPEWTDVPCRFDLALVKAKKINGGESLREGLGSLSGAIAIGAPFFWSGYEFTLMQYLEGV